MNELVSVVVPVYNVEAYLDKCVSSIVGQSYKNLEIILVDDGSPDKSPLLCDEWAKKDPRIKVVHKKNEGLGMARNTGIECANGEYICFIDSDDYVDERMIEKSLCSAVENNADAVLFGMVSVDSAGKCLDDINFNLSKLVYKNSEIKDELVPEVVAHDYRKGAAHNYCLSACTVLFKLSAIKENGLMFLSEREMISEDSFFLLDFYSKAHCVALLPQALYFRFVNMASLTTTYRADRQEKNDFFLTKTLDLAEKSGYSVEINSRIIMLYQNFTLAALKQIVKSDNNSKPKKAMVKDILGNSFFRKYIGNSVLKMQKPSIRLFYTLAGFKFYNICYLLLCFKK